MLYLINYVHLLWTHWLWSITDEVHSKILVYGVIIFLRTSVMLILKWNNNLIFYHHQRNILFFIIYISFTKFNLHIYFFVFPTSLTINYQAHTKWKFDSLMNKILSQVLFGDWCWLFWKAVEIDNKNNKNSLLSSHIEKR